MATYDEVQSRDTDLVPEDISYAIIQEAAKGSAALTLGNRVPMSTKKSRSTFIDTFPDAYFVDGDSGLKQTTNMTWDTVWMEAEPIAALVVIPDDYIDDSAVPLWSEIRPRVASAIGRTLDNAIFWGTNKPASWTMDDIYGATVTAGNVATETSDLGLDVGQLCQTAEEDGINLTGFVCGPGLRWRLRNLRVADAPVFASSVDSNVLPAGVTDTLFDMPLKPVTNGTWDKTKATLFLGDWSRLYVGVRQDITYSIHSDAVITDADGKVVYNAMQQDSKIMRVVARYGYTVVTPSTDLSNKPWPFYCLRPSGAPDS